VLDHHPPPHRNELRRPAGQRENRGRIGITEGRRAGDVGSEGGEIGVLPYLERSNARLDTKGARSANRRQLEGLVGAKGVMPLCRGAMNEHGETRLIQNIHAIVAGD
jgi:hypothetical protein